MPLRIGITLGDCAGIGPEIVDLALRSDRIPKASEYKIIGKYPGCSPGQPTIETAHAAAAALEEAVTSARRGEFDAVVTGPIHKGGGTKRAVISGTDEVLSRELPREKFREVLTGGKITVAIVTTHIRARVPNAIKHRDCPRGCARRFSVLSSKSIPRIAVAV